MIAVRKRGIESKDRSRENSWKVITIIKVKDDGVLDSEGCNGDEQG